ncbi:MAG: DUF4301 family protein [Prevotellaceae bacterium]|nr:DUF4301 family protein [Prevotellaceae bacterium]
MIQENDRLLLQQKGISVQQMEAQLRQIQAGFPFLELHAAAAAGRGIFVPDAGDEEAAVAAWESYSGQVVKFVPASGAASRMFKELFAFAGGDSALPATEVVRLFFERLGDAPFCDALDEACRRIYGAGIGELTASARHRDVVCALLSAEGLNYGALPKGLLKFHRYASGARTPLEEHLVEGALYARRPDGTVSVHFTVSPEHRPLFGQLVAEVAPRYAQEFGCRFEVSFSEQKASTDTVAANPDGTPFRQADGSLLFRPGGHGALIENLGEIDADIVFVKNIDNVVPDGRKADTVRYKKLLAGMLVSLQRKAFAYLERLDSGCYSREDLMEMLTFVQKQLCTKNPTTKTLEDTELAIYLRSKLDRPMRVCGMVRNVGEPGGGPFLAYNADGTISPQILESSQIDMADEARRAMFEQGTHFNPVDLVCALRDYKGRPFDLKKHVDPRTGFISQKSKDGRELLALELPGLWNGAMADWSTVFIEVPLSTFNPVKTVNDLYRPEHQP